MVSLAFRTDPTCTVGRARFQRRDAIFVVWAVTGIGPSQKEASHVPPLDDTLCRPWGGCQGMALTRDSLSFSTAVQDILLNTQGLERCPPRQKSRVGRLKATVELLLT